MNRVFLGAGAIQASWPRWLVYAWIILEANRLASLRSRTRNSVPHPLEFESAWWAIRNIWECLLLWLTAETLVLGISWSLGAWFHVELWQVSTNLLLSLSASMTLVLVVTSFRNHIWILNSLVLAVGLMEFLILNHSSGWDRPRFALATLLLTLGLNITLNTLGIHRCKLQS